MCIVNLRDNDLEAPPEAESRLKGVHLPKNTTACAASEMRHPATESSQVGSVLYVFQLSHKPQTAVQVCVPDETPDGLFISLMRDSGP